MATVVLPRLLDPATGGRRSLEIDGQNIRAVITRLLEEIPQVEVHLFDRTGALRPHVMCFVDGEITRLEDRSEAVDERTQIRFVQAVSGG